MRLWGTPRRGWLGMDWGTRVIKLARLEREGSGYRFAHKASVRRVGPATESLDGDPSLWSVEDFPIGLVREGPLRSSKASCLLPAYLTDARSFDLPAVEPAMRRSIIEGELIDAFGERAQERIFDFWETSGPKQQARMEVISVEERVVGEVAAAIDRAGPTCEVIDSLPLVLGRAIELCIGRHVKPQIALDWGYTGATLCVYREGQPIYSRLLRGCGVHLLARGLGETLGVSTAEAEELLIDPGLPSRSATSELQELTAQVVNESIQNLLEQVNKTLGYVDSEWPGVVGEDFWLFGGGGTIGNIGEYLAEKVGLDVRPWTLAREEKGRSAAERTDVLFAPAAALSALAWEK